MEMVAESKHQIMKQKTKGGKKGIVLLDTKMCYTAATNTTV